MKDEKFKLDDIKKDIIAPLKGDYKVEEDRNKYSVGSKNLDYNGTTQPAHDGIAPGEESNVGKSCNHIAPDQVNYVERNIPSIGIIASDIEQSCEDYNRAEKVGAAFEEPSKLKTSLPKSITKLFQKTSAVILIANYLMNKHDDKGSRSANCNGSTSGAHNGISEGSSGQSGLYNGCPTPNTDTRDINIPGE